MRLPQQVAGPAVASIIGTVPGVSPAVACRCRPPPQIAEVTQAAGCRGAARHQCGSSCSSAGRPRTGRQQVAAVCLRCSSRSPVGWPQPLAWKCQTVATQTRGRPKCCRAAVSVLPGVRAGAGGRQFVGPSVVGLPLAACAAALPLRCVLAVGLGRQLRRPWGTELLRMPCRCRPRSCRRRSAAAVDETAGQPSPVWIPGGPARMSVNKTPDAPAGRRAAPVSNGEICTFCPSGFGRVSGCVKWSLAVPAPACRIGHALPPRSSAAACLACAAGCRHTPAPPPRPARLRSRATPLHTAAHCAGP